MSSIIQTYETMLFKDFPASCERDVIHQLWKGAFYRPIEEFRKMIKKVCSQVFIIVLSLFITR